MSIATAVPPASAGGTGFVPILPSTDYASRPYPPQDVEPTTRIGALIHPTLGFPALVRPGGRLSVFLRPGSPVGRGADDPASGSTGGISAADVRAVLELRRGAGSYFPAPAGSGAAAVVPSRPPFPSIEREIVATVPLAALALHARAPELWEVEVEVPLETPALTWDLSVTGPSALMPGGREVQPLAVRVLPVRREGADAGFRIVLVGDHQLWDPSSFTAAERNPGTYPSSGVVDTARALALQVHHEVGLLDPAFVLYGGDLTFGIDYRRELADSLALWERGSFGTFLAVGNHDAYANYSVDIPGGIDAASAAWGRCSSLMPEELELSAVFAFLVCFYGDTRDVLFAHLVEDGLVAWEKAFGPAYYAFDHADFRFIVLNTYDGTAPRRHAYVVGLEWAGFADIGVPTVDNYGGYLSPEQLAWFEEQAREADEAGRTVVVVGHHDPRGNPAAEGRYVANDSFPTEPFGIGALEEWNFDASWDSDPTDARGPETAVANSGTAAVEIVARHASYYLSAHAHADADARFATGDEILPGIRASRPVEFIRVTTASSATRDEGYAGYRLLTARDGRLDRTYFDVLRGLGSVPAGNFWLTGRVRPGLAFPSVVVHGHNALPGEVTTRFTLVLPEFAPGYVARLEGSDEPDASLELIDAYDARRYKIVSWALPLPGVGPSPARFPAEPGGEAVTRVVVKPRPGNKPPVPHIEVLRGNAGPWVVSGDLVVLSASGTVDPDGDPVWRLLWSFGDGGSAVGEVVAHAFVGTGERVVRILATDRYGSSATASLRLQVRPPPAPLPPLRAPARRGCACRAPGGDETPPAGPLWGLALVLVAGFRVAVRRERFLR